MANYKKISISQTYFLKDDKIWSSM